MFALIGLCHPVRAASRDPQPTRGGPDTPLLEERLQRLTTTVELLEAALAEQERKLNLVIEELQRLREEVASASTRRPWAEDLRQLSDAIAEVDRKRAADNELVLKVLSELKTPAPAPAEPARPQGTKPGRAADSTEPSKNRPEQAEEKAIEYTMLKNETLSGVVSRFNADAKKQGYQPLTVAQVMEFNKIEDPRRIREGARIWLQVISK